MEGNFYIGGREETKYERGRETEGRGTRQEVAREKDISLAGEKSMRLTSHAGPREVYVAGGEAFPIVCERVCGAAPRLGTA